MANEVTVFDFGDFPVRVVDREGEPWFVLRDVCRVLSMADPSNAVRMLDDDEKGTCEIRTPGGQQKMTIINEPGLYWIVMRSDKPQARPFQKWVTGTVLPSIRKNGGYIAGQEKAEAGDISADDWLGRIEQ